jgi:hypothetical protein
MGRRISARATARYGSAAVVAANRGQGQDEAKLCGGAPGGGRLGAAAGGRKRGLGGGEVAGVQP